MNAFESLEDKSYYVKFEGKEPQEVILTKDLQELMCATDEEFNTAILDIKFSSVAQEINTQCFFYETEDGEIMTSEAAIAVAAKGPTHSDFCNQMSKYVRNIVDFCLSMQEKEESDVDSMDDD